MSNIDLNSHRQAVALSEALCFQQHPSHSHGDVLRLHVPEVGPLPLAHQGKVQWAVTEGAGRHCWAFGWEPRFLPHLHQFFW